MGAAVKMGLGNDTREKARGEVAAGFLPAIPMLETGVIRRDQA